MKTKGRFKKLIVVGMIFLLTAVSTPVTMELVYAAGKDTWISDTAYAATIEYGEAYGISPELLQALIEAESSGKPRARNGGCKGLCQIYEKYHYSRMEKLGVWDIYSERGNILVATDYLSELFEEYGEACLVLDIYNGNSNAQYNYERGILSDYANGILERCTELERLHGK